MNSGVSGGRPFTVLGILAFLAGIAALAALAAAAYGYREGYWDVGFALADDHPVRGVGRRRRVRRRAGRARRGAARGRPARPSSSR